MADEKFVTIFPGLRNVHLAKDIGKIPYVMQRDFGYDSAILCYDNDDYSLLDVEVPGLDLEFIDKRPVNDLFHRFVGKPSFSALGTEQQSPNKFFLLLNVVHKLVRERNDIDVIHLPGLNPMNVLFGAAFRSLSDDGKIYMKIDWSNQSVAESRSTPPKWSRILKKTVFDYVDIDVMSIATENVREFLWNDHWLLSQYADRIHHLPTCVDVQHLSDWAVDFELKDDVIFHAGRLGEYAKASEVILDAFVGVAREYPEWRLVLAGTMTDDFEKHFHTTLDENEAIADRIDYLGFVSDREELYGQYQQSKVFALPSRYEGFGLSLVESGFFGNVVLGSDIPAIREFTNDGEHGYICPPDDTPCFQETLEHIFTHENELREYSARTAENTRENYDWHDFCFYVDQRL